MAKMIKDKVVTVHPVTGEKGTWVRIVKNWVDPSKADDKPFNGMAYQVEGSKVIRDKAGKDISAFVS